MTTKMFTTNHNPAQLLFMGFIAIVCGVMLQLKWELSFWCYIKNSKTRFFYKHLKDRHPNVLRPD